MSSLIVVHPDFDATWPFAADHLHALWASQGPVDFVRLSADDRRSVGLVATRPEEVTRLVALGVPVTAGCLEQYPGADVAFSGFRLFGEIEREMPVEVDPKRPVDLSTDLLYHNHVLQSATVARRSTLVDAGGYDESRRFSEDYELWLRLSLTSKFVYTGAITVEYRTHPDQVTARPARMYQGAWEARDQHLARLIQRRPADRTRIVALLQRRWVHWS